MNRAAALMSGGTTITVAFLSSGSILLSGRKTHFRASCVWSAKRQREVSPRLSKPLSRGVVAITESSITLATFWFFLTSSGEQEITLQQTKVHCSQR